MTDRDELVKLADAYEAGTAKCVASGYEEFGPAFQRERDLIVTALRRLASSEGEVKGEPEPVAWLRHGPDGDEFAICDEDADGAFAVFATAPPADAGMREALELAAGILQEMIQRGLIVVGVTGTNGYYIGEGVMPKIAAALTMPGATTKSDGGDRSCTCHPDDHPPKPCPQKFALSECVEATKPSDPSSTRTTIDPISSVGLRGAVSAAVAVHKSLNPTSTRSDVTVEELEVWLLENLRLDADPHQDARALLDQFEIRRTK